MESAVDVPLWERMVVAATGPVVTALLALLVLNLVTAWAQRRREAGDTREELAAELTETANALYLALQAFWRAARDVPLAQRRTAGELAEQRTRLEAVYLEARTKGQVLEQRLAIYFEAREPKQSWHAVTDLLTVRYFLLLEGEPARRQAIRAKNAGPEHSGLTADELNDPALLLRTYRAALARCIATLWRHDLDRRGRHLRDSDLVSNWHGDAATDGAPLPPGA